MIEIIDLHKSFDGKEILKGITATFSDGKVNLIIGQSGSGKTVLLKSIVGIHEVDSGQILLHGRDLVKMSPKERKQIRREIGMVFQGGALFDSYTVLENVMFPLDMFTDLSYNEKVEKAEYFLRRVNLENVNNLYPSEISGGMQKRVAIARAIVLNPKYLFCDEPNSGLDPKTAKVIDELIASITYEYNMTTVINTHDLSSMLEIGDNIVFIYKGEKKWQGNKDQLLNSGCKELDEFIYSSSILKNR
jgi:phospholipid/cholesterol/gamma-HCH transport system ATP-binding protein